MMLWGCMGRKEGEKENVYLLCGVWWVGGTEKVQCNAIYSSV